ncbi:hypothetical protein MSj_02669 [Microcystis aeruginosa Sj]|uniref:Uncharacterized protein n=1 Tax=Microcystis aeruginosa Sj TaxID=1979544 RepID=A0A2Z6UPM1_MICAE|nr:hypothetical protein MSj_02669 [Microcystis aeruginosa Sj]
MVYSKTTANAQNIQKGFSLSMSSTKPQPVIGVSWWINAVYLLSSPLNSHAAAQKLAQHSLLYVTIQEEFISGVSR